MSSAANLSGIFIVLNVNVLAFKTFHTDYEYKRDRPLVTDWIVINSEEATGQASLFVCFQSCFENVHTIRSRDTV